MKDTVDLDVTVCARCAQQAPRCTCARAFPKRPPGKKTVRLEVPRDDLRRALLGFPLELTAVTPA